MGRTHPKRARYWTAMARRAVQVRSDLVIAVLDLAIGAGAYIAAIVLRFDGNVPDRYWHAFWRFLPVLLAIVLGSNTLIGLYGKLWRHASVHEARRLAMSGALIFGVLLLAEQQHRRLPYSVVVLGTLIAVVLMGLVRFQSRLFSFRRNAHHEGLRVVVVGAGERGIALVRTMLDDPRSGYHPVAFVDDRTELSGRDVAGVTVAGPVDGLADVVTATNAHLVVVAATSPSHDLLRRCADGAEAAGVALKVLPGLEEAVNVGAALRSMRDLRIEDLLGRGEVATDLGAVRQMIAGSTVLVTGAGGSIGSEIARQVAAGEPHRLILLDHDETHLHDVAAELTGPIDVCLADVRNRHQIRALFRQHRPTIVFHAAAHKHVPILEEHPTEAAATNVLGTSNVIDAAVESDVDRLVLISTDKAVHPISVMGASKRVCEQLLVARAPRHAAYCAVRFGNVLGSRGSVVPTFLRQIEAGGPVTVTDRRMSRFFMSIHEAVQLVLQAAAMSSAGGGEIFMLDMGEPVKIHDLAERMIRLSGRRPGQDIEIRITGIRPGEKLEEQLSRPDENSAPTDHESINRLAPLPIRRDQLEQGVLMLEHYVAELNNARCGRLLHLLASGQYAGSAPDTPA